MATQDPTAVKHNCDLCEEDNPEYLDMVPGAAVCGNCGFVYVPYRRSPEAIAKAWDDVWGEGYTSAWPMVKARLTYVAEWIDQNIGIEGKSVLDIGAGEGEFLDITHRMGAGLICGIEPSRDNVKKMHERGIGCYWGMVENAPVEEYGDNDIVTILWTLENCGDCIDFLKRAKSFLKPDGHLVVATGSRILVPYKKPFSSYVGKNAPDLHCFRFSARSLGGACAQAGLWTRDWNRYEDGDWLVVSAQASDKPIYASNDNPEEVLQFFKSWRETFP